ncbi:MAG: DNA-binding transcriptional regulator [Kiritimatiellae bacterium]|nr:DNA-binding transcriptional regulator [Kiritimatiellia bacterium]
MISPASGSRLAGVAHYAKEHGWNLMVQDRLGYQPPVWRGDGMLVTLRTDAATADLVKRVRRNGMPVVDLTVNRPDIRLPRVTSDHAAIGRLAAEHFAARDFRHAAWFSLGWTHVHTLRFDAFAATCRRLGMDAPLKWTYTDMAPAAHLGNWRTFARTLGARLVSAPKPLAVLTYDEADAVRLLAVCQEQSISVPEEVAILSIGNDPILCENQSVTLSSIDQNLERGGYEAAALLDRLMDGKAPPRTSLLVPPAGIVARQSTDTRAVADPTLRHALELLGANLARPYGADQLAAALSLPRFKVDRLFASGLGRSVGDELLRQRLARVKLLLKRPELTVASIARQTGFCHAAYLTNTFKRVFGITPRAWRKQPHATA